MIRPLKPYKGFEELRTDNKLHMLSAFSNAKAVCSEEAVHLEANRQGRPQVPEEHWPGRPQVREGGGQDRGHCRRGSDSRGRGRRRRLRGHVPGADLRMHALPPAPTLHRPGHRDLRHTPLRHNFVSLISEHNINNICFGLMISSSNSNKELK